MWKIKSVSVFLGLMCLFQTLLFWMVTVMQKFSQVREEFLYKWKSLNQMVKHLSILFMYPRALHFLKLSTFFKISKEVLREYGSAITLTLNLMLYYVVKKQANMYLMSLCIN